MNKICRACDKPNPLEILDLDLMPSVGGFLESKELFSNDTKYPLKIYSCENCGLVQILEPIDPDVLFKNYSFSSSTVKPLIEHFQNYAAWIKKSFSPKSVFEFGCNDGILLSELEKININCSGIDISENITKMAREKGLAVYTGYFNEDFSVNYIKNNNGFDVVTGSNAFAHNSDPVQILKAAHKILNNDGILCLEVMYAGDLLDKFQWDTLYHEHLTFYSLSTLTLLLENYGFKIFEAELLQMHGGSLRIAASKNQLVNQSKNVKKILNDEINKKLNDSDTWVNFGKNAKNKIEIVKNTMKQLSKNYKIAAYGAAGKAAMWFNACDMDYLEYVVDSSPLRANKFMPGTHTKIVFPDHFKQNPVDYIFISAWNYADVISNKESWFTGTWVVPLPNLIFFSSNA